MSAALRSRLALALAPLLLTACAHGGEKLDRVAITDVARADPWEKTNREIYKINDAIDSVLFKPVTDVYRTVVPQAPRRGIANVYDNLQEPTHFVNAVAQGKIKSAFRAVDRLLINGFLGLGVADHATDMGLDRQEHDFGQTMAVWGVPSGPFVTLPFLGPSTARDSIGFFVDFLFDPADLARNRLLSQEERFLSLGVRIIDIRSGLRDQGEQMLAGAADPYATIRSAWLQLRRYQLFDGSLPDQPEEDDLPLPAPEDAPPEAAAETQATDTAAQTPAETLAETPELPDLAPTQPQAQPQN